MSVNFLASFWVQPRRDKWQENAEESTIQPSAKQQQPKCVQQQTKHPSLRWWDFFFLLRRCNPPQLRASACSAWCSGAKILHDGHEIWVLNRLLIADNHKEQMLGRRRGGEGGNEGGRETARWHGTEEREEAAGGGGGAQIRRGKRSKDEEWDRERGVMEIRRRRTR